MDISSKIKIIPIEIPFLPVFTEYLWDNFKGRFPDLSEVLIVFPSQRNKFYFRRYLLQVSGKTGMISPTMLTVEELVDILFGRLGGENAKDLNSLERNLILKGVVDSLKIEFWKDLDFLRFLSIGRKLLSFYDELYKEDIALSEIEELQGILHFPEKYVKDELPIIRKIFKKYKEALDDRGYTDTENKYNLIVREFDTELLKDFEHVYVSGILSPTRAECYIIKRILLDHSSELIIHSNKSEIKKELSSPYYHHSRLLSYLDASVDKIEIIGKNGSSSIPKTTITKVKNDIQETFYIREALSQLRDRYEPHRIAVVLPDSKLVPSLRAALKCDGYEFNISMGLPLSQTPLYSFLQLLRNMVVKNFHHEEFLAFIRHPLLKNAILEDSEARPIIYAIERKMVDENMVFFRFDDFGEEEVRPVIDIIKRFSLQIMEDINFTDYLKGIEEMLNLLLSFNQDFLESGLQGVKEFLERIHRLTKFIIYEDIFPTGLEKLDFLLRVFKNDSYPISGDPFRGIQLIGVLEARNLDFDCVILPSMNEGVFPKKSEKDLFVPAQLRKEAGLPYDKERENLYYYYFTQLIKAKKEVFISFVENEDRDVSSRFVNNLLDEGIRLTEEPMIFDRCRGRKMLPVRKDKSIIKKLENMVYAQHSLKDYRVCPYRFYMTYIIGIKEPVSIIEEAGAVQWGNIIHRTLQLFYTNNFPDGFGKAQTEDAKTALYSLTEKALKKEIGYLKASSLFDLEAYKMRLRRFLDEELKRFEKGYRINCVEKRLDCMMDVGERSIKLQGKTDRIDMLEGKYYIIDYKTGSMIDRRLYRVGEEFTEFQLPLYALLFSGEDFSKIGGLVYYYISRDSIKIVDIMEENYLTDFRDKILMPTLNEILDPEIGFARTEDETICRMCSYRWFCGK